jgi:3-hydroxyacyl-CoA dehydrogenase / enoyl-CoA hydratase / 3-hydroxybutyryl-CoA epimerase
MTNLTLLRGDDGIAVITWDMPGRSMNVMNDASLAEFAAAIDNALADSDTKGVVITSGKPAFIAGADLEWLEAMLAGTPGETEGERVRNLFDRFMDVHRLFRRIETAKKPFVAAINGTALGGGFEVCLACHRRIATDDPRALLGLPETKVGLFPGFGGTQRYLRMLGALDALPVLLEGTSMSPAQAVARGLVDEAAPPSELLARAKEWVGAAPAEALVKPWDKPGFVVPGADPRTLAGVQAFSAANAMQRAKTYGNYPALDAIQSVVYRGMLVPLDTGLRIEAKAFAKLALDPRARNMVRTQFINLQRANRLARRPAAVARKRFSRIGVLGAGLMGSGIADVAARAGIDVVLLDVSEAAAGRGLDHIRRQQQTAVERGRIGDAEARAIVARVQPTADYARLADAELVIEAVFENREVKAEVTRRAEAVLGGDAVFASNTSTLPITGLARASTRPERFIGLHFFSPVARMPLVEIIRGERTGEEALAWSMDFVRQIGKTPIVVNDSRGFYTSRVFGTYTREAVLMLAEGVRPALIENGGKAAGMPMAPLALCDEVAISLIHQVAVQTAKDLGDKYRPTAADRLIAEMVERQNRPGRRADKGFYDYPADGPKRLWPGLSGLAPEAATQPSLDDVKTRYLAIQALEAARCFEENVVTDPADADVGALLGWGFAPWTGGPLSYIDMLGTGAFVELCDRLAQQHGERFLPNPMLRELARRGAAIYGDRRAAA